LPKKILRESHFSFLRPALETKKSRSLGAIIQLQLIFMVFFSKPPSIHIGTATIESMLLEVGRALFLRVQVGLGLHTSGSGFWGLEKFAK
jgi:hypothetical protein